jgi:hypothetical protein
MGRLTLALVLLSLPVATAAGVKMPCAADQLKAAGQLGKAQLSCWSKYVRSPEKDPAQSRLVACSAAAEADFVNALNNVIDRAISKAERCSLNSEGHAVLDEHFRQPLESLKTGILTGWEHRDVSENKLLGSLLKDAGAFWSKRFAKEFKNVRKPDACRANEQVASLQRKFEGKFQRRIDRALRRGVIYKGSEPFEIKNEIESLMASFAPLTTADGKFFGKSLWRGCQSGRYNGWHRFIGTISHTDLTGGPFTFSYQVSIDRGLCSETGQGSGSVGPDGSIVADYSYSGCNASGVADDCIGCISATAVSVRCSGRDLVGDTCSFRAFPHLIR